MTVKRESDGKLLFRCGVERRYEGVFYIWGESRQEAQDDANELLGSLDEDFYGVAEDDVYAVPAQQNPERGEPVWSGGPDGEWDDYEPEPTK